MDKYIVSVSLNIEVEASSPTVAMVKARKKFGKHFVNQIDVFNPDGTEAGSISPAMELPGYLLSPLRVPGRGPKP